MKSKKFVGMVVKYGGAFINLKIVSLIDFMVSEINILTKFL